MHSLLTFNTQQFLNSVQLPSINFSALFFINKKNFSFTACVTRQSRYVYMLFELKIQFYTVLRRLRINVNSKMISQFTLTKKRAFGVKKFSHVDGSLMIHSKWKQEQINIFEHACIQMPKYLQIFFWRLALIDFLVF